MDFPKISNNYKIIEMLGEGGMGSVYLAEDKVNSNRLTAIKTIKSAMLKNYANLSLTLFRHEYEIMSKLWHPNLSRVYDFGELDDGYYIAMEYIRGRELNSIVQERSKIPLEEALPVMVELLRAVEFVHSRNIIYSDIKPQNIMITEDNKVKLIDFGISDFDYETSKIVKGTLGYIAPEVLVNGEKKDHRADIFSLGMLFYRMLTGNSFYSDGSINSIVSTLRSSSQYEQTYKMVSTEHIDSYIREIIEKMFAYNSNDRYPSCASVIMAINKKLNKNFPIETEETKEAFVTGVPFTGRDNELRCMELFINGNENKLLLITGSRGVGKSRVFKEFEKNCNLNGITYFPGNSVKGESYESFLTIMSKLLFIIGDDIKEQKKKYLKRLLPDHHVLSSLPVEQNEIMDARTLRDVLVETISAIIVEYAAKADKITVLAFENLGNADEISLEIINEIIYKIQRNGIKNLKLLAECRDEEKEKLTDFFAKLEERERLKILKLNDFTGLEVKKYIENSFGAKFIDHTLSKNIDEIYGFCGGNPLFLQQLIKSMVLENLIRRDEPGWILSGSFSDIKLPDNVQDIVKKKIKSLKLSEDYYKAMFFLSFSTNEMLNIDFYRQYAQSEININWQTLFDLLVRKELLLFENGYYRISNKLYKEVIHSMLTAEEKTDQHGIWIKILEQQTGMDADVEKLPDELLFDLSYHYYTYGYSDLDVFLEKTGKFLFELGKREKAKYSNKKAIQYLSRLSNVGFAHNPINNI